MRQFLKAAQMETNVDIPVPPPVPIEQDHDQLPVGYTIDGLESRFGKMQRKNKEGVMLKPTGFNIRGAISNAWISRGAQEHRTMTELPPSSYMVEVDNPKIQIDGKPATASIVLFDGRGADNWVLYRPDSSISWRWMI